MIEQHKCLIDEEYLKFRDKVHKLVYNAEVDEDMSDVDRELYRMHVIDLYEELATVMDQWVHGII